MITFTCGNPAWAITCNLEGTPNLRSGHYLVFTLEYVLRIATSAKKLSYISASMD